MPANFRKSMRLLPHERQLLRDLYEQWKISVDRYAKCPLAMARFTDTWNSLSERCDTVEDVRHYLLLRRKKGGWVTFKGKQSRVVEFDTPTLTIEQQSELIACYIELFGPDQFGSDHLAYDRELTGKLVRAFATRAGVYISGTELYALIMGMRKAGQWVRVTTGKPKPPATGFGDIDQIAV